ncbi:MAG: hypothetical protein WBE68_15115 [Candidatus Nitrosopolaris sp.]
MEAAQLITIIGGALIVILTSIFAFTPNSVNPSSIPALKSYALSIINNERPLRQGADIYPQIISRLKPHYLLLRGPNSVDSI